MPDILTLTMNPALDVSTSVDRLVPMHKLRCEAAQEHPGGGGVNVARVLHRFGAQVCALFPAGGVTGQELCHLLSGEGVPHQALAIAGETRESFSVHEQTSGLDYRFVLPGPTLQVAEWQACLDHVAQRATPPRFLVASGSLPPGVPDDFLAQLARLCQGRGIRLVLDSSGAPLAAALQSADSPGPYLIKPSLREWRDLTGQPLPDEASQRQAAQALIRQGRVHIVALSLGEDGAMLVTADRAWRAHSLDITVASTIGAGDSFLAGLIWSLDTHPDDLPRAFRYAMAAGAAALLSAGTALCQPDDVERLSSQVRIEPMPA